MASSESPREEGEAWRSVFKRLVKAGVLAREGAWDVGILKKRGKESGCLFFLFFFAGGFGFFEVCVFYVCVF